MNAYFNFLILATGILSTYTDVFLKKIRNIHLWFIILCAAIGYIIFYLRGQLQLSPSLLLNPLFGFVTGFVLYLSGIFKGGDAKLFFTYSLLLPLNIHQNILPFSFLSLFVNTFVISFLFMLPLFFTDIILKKDRFIKRVLTRATGLDFLKIFLITFCISWLIEPIFSFLRFKDNIFITFLIIYFGYRFILKLNNENRTKWLFFSILTVGAMGRFIFMPETFVLGNILLFLKRTALFSLVFYCLRIMILFSGRNKLRIPLAPFMFIGAILANTRFLIYLLKFLSYLR